MRALAKLKQSNGELHLKGQKITLDAIPLNTQKFKILKINNITLMDSMSFLNDSLEKLVDNLKASNHGFDLTRGWVRDEQKLSLLTRKGIYPYEYITDLAKLEETELPPPEEFASKLAMTTGASAEDYAHAQTVWNTFRCETIKDYTEIYVVSDCYLLLEVVLELRQTLFEEFNLDLCHYWSLPMMAKDMLLKKTKAKIELMTDPEMIHMVRDNIRGGLSFVNQRYCNVREEAERTGEPCSIVYLDAVNLYGFAMTKPMPVGDYRWLSVDEMDHFDVNGNIDDSDEAETGYFLEVTLEYGEDYHLDHNSMPLAAHRLDITGDMLSEYAKKALTSQKKKPAAYKATKLSATFMRRDKYVCHGVNLKLYLELGMKLVKIHRIMSFRQEPFIKPYIQFCAKMRAQSVSKSRSNTYKLVSDHHDSTCFPSIFFFASERETTIPPSIIFFLFSRASGRQRLLRQDDRELHRAHGHALRADEAGVHEEEHGPQVQGQHDPGRGPDRGLPGQERGTPQPVVGGGQVDLGVEQGAHDQALLQGHPPAVQRQGHDPGVGHGLLRHQAGRSHHRSRHQRAEAGQTDGHFQLSEGSLPLRREQQERPRPAQERDPRGRPGRVRGREKQGVRHQVGEHV